MLLWLWNVVKSIKVMHCSPCYFVRLTRWTSSCLWRGKYATPSSPEWSWIKTGSGKVIAGIEWAGVHQKGLHTGAQHFTWTKESAVQCSRAEQQEDASQSATQGSQRTDAARWEKGQEKTYKYIYIWIIPTHIYLDFCICEKVFIKTDPAGVDIHTAEDIIVNSEKDGGVGGGGGRAAARVTAILYNQFYNYREWGRGCRLSFIYMFLLQGHLCRPDITVLVDWA